MSEKQEKGIVALIRDNRVGIIVGVLVVGLGWFIYDKVSGDHVPRKRVMDSIAIKVLPPPPPPPPKEPPPEPPKIMEKPKIQPPVDKPEEKKQVDESPPELKLDAKGGPGSDSFGLGGKLGGADYTGGGGGTRWGHYGVLLQDYIGRRIRQDDKLDAAKFRCTLAVWISAAGRVQRVEIQHTTGDAEIDARVKEAVANMDPLPEAPPSDMPQPAHIRVGARAASST